MRKILFLLTTLLSGSLAFAQEAETTTGNELEVRIIPRFEVNPYAPVKKGGEWDYDFGYSSLYTQIEGSFGEHFSYFFSNHWLSTDPSSLYVIEEEGIDGQVLKSANIFRNDAWNWLDMGYVTLTFGDWNFSVGKDMMVVGSFEEDAYDYDSHAALNSCFWNINQVYQWGLKAQWAPDDQTDFSFQVTSSPYSCRPFGESWYDYNGGGNLKAFNLGFHDECEWFSLIWSANAVEYEKNRYFGMLGLGNQLYIGNVTVTLDAIGKVTALKGPDNCALTMAASILYNYEDKWDFFIKAGFDSPADIDFINFETNYLFCGAGVQYYPLKNSKDLRFHAVAAYNNYGESISLNAGLTYNFCLTDLFKK